MKTITYCGEQYEVEDWVKFVAMDSDGCIYAFSKKPKINKFDQWDSGRGDCTQIGDFTPYWRDSLEKV